MAITQYYVDPAINGNSGTGTIGDPYGDLQYALNTVTRNATNGDQFNIKAGTAEVLAASLTLATYGTPDGNSPLVLRGYTSAANDGGKAEIDCGGVTMWAATTYDYVQLGDLEIHTFGDNNGIALRSYCTVYRCEVHHGASNPASGKYLVTGTVGLVVLGCELYADSKCRGINLTNAGIIAYNYIHDTTLAAETNGGYTIIGNIIRQSNAGAYGIYATGISGFIAHNSIYNSAAGTLQGIDVDGLCFGVVVLNNIVEGFSGAGGEGIQLAAKRPSIVGFNAFYNNTATYTKSVDVPFELGNDTTLGASAFVNAGTSDMDINGTVSGVTEAAFPTAFFNNASTSPKADKGAVQAGAGSGGGGRPAFGDRTGGKF